MKLRPLLYLSAIVFSMPAVLQAADSTGGFAVDGIGARSCADLTKAASEKDVKMMAAFASWTDGFMTGYNIHQPDTFDITPWQTVELTLTKIGVFCNDNPDAPFVEAAGKLTAILRDGRLAQSDSLVLLRAGKQGTYVYSSMIPRIKAGLEQHNIAVSSADGDFDAAFSAALKTFQAAEKLPQSGLPDQPTLNALLR
jgi:peptidoglycan hydrolase-like protein with peptidoglycan-binding domain